MALTTDNLDLEVEAKASGTGVITITYYVWVRSKSMGAVIANATGADIAGDTWKSVSRTITVNVMSCIKYGAITCP